MTARIYVTQNKTSVHIIVKFMFSLGHKIGNLAKLWANIVSREWQEKYITEQKHNCWVDTGRTWDRCLDYYFQLVVSINTFKHHTVILKTAVTSSMLSNFHTHFCTFCYASFVQFWNCKCTVQIWSSAAT